MCAPVARHISVVSISLFRRLSEGSMGQPISSIVCTTDHSSRINITMGRPERKRMTTGAHIVCDIFCVSCGTR